MPGRGLLEAPRLRNRVPPHLICVKIPHGLKSSSSLSGRIRSLFGAAFGFHPLPRLQRRTDGHALVPPGDPAVELDAQVRRHFGLRDPIVVVVQTPRPNGIFNTDTLRRVHDLTAVLAKLDGVPPGGVTSLATEKGDRVRPGTLDFRPFLDVVPDNPEEMALFRGD